MRALVRLVLCVSTLGGGIALLSCVEREEGTPRAKADPFLPMLTRPALDPRFAAFDALDLTNMPTGDALAHHDVKAIPWTSVKGPDVKRTWRDQKRVEIRDLALHVDWPEPTTKYSGTLFFLKDCEEVVIENVSILHNHPDYRGQHSFLMESCGKVTIRNVFSAGAVDRSHIRLEGCREYDIERVEISGWDYGKAGVRCGAGIVINNGITRDNGNVELAAENPKDLDWGVIRDCWIHDYLANDGNKERNQDGILFHAPSNGIVFNCVFDRWKAGDGAVDDSHRRHDPKYKNKVHRIERCIFRDNQLVKTNGATGSPDCVIVWMNNVYINSWMGDYHRGWTNWHIHETYHFEEKAPAFIKNWGMREGPTAFANGLLSAPKGLEVVYWQSGKAEKNGYRLFRADHLLYLMPQPTFWMRGLGAEIRPREAWLAEGLERDCVIAHRPAGFADAARRDLRLAAGSPAIGLGSPAFLDPPDAALRVTRDFNGKRRENPPAVGAFEAGQ